jgi:hypothetical protein
MGRIAETPKRGLFCNPQASSQEHRAPLQDSRPAAACRSGTRFPVRHEFHTPWASASRRSPGSKSPRPSHISAKTSICWSSSHVSRAAASSCRVGLSPVSSRIATSLINEASRSTRRVSGVGVRPQPRALACGAPPRRLADSGKRPECANARPPGCDAGRGRGRRRTGIGGDT